jgi:hypothetical protein
VTVWHGMTHPESELREQRQIRIDEALVHTAYGTGLCEVVRGETATFYIQSKDANGDPLRHGGHIFQVRVF